MPAFHLHIRMGDQIVHDLEGIDLPDLASARTEAIGSVRSIMRDEIAEGELDLDRSIEIHGPDDRHLATIEFADTLLIRVGERRRLNVKSKA